MRTVKAILLLLAFSTMLEAQFVRTVQTRVGGGQVAPVVSTPSLPYSGAAGSLTLETVTPGAVIHYNTTGPSASCSDTTYSGAITVSATTTYYAVACKTGYADSAQFSGTYTIPVGGNWTAVQHVAGRKAWGTNVSCPDTSCTLSVSSTGTGNILGMLVFDGNENTLASVSGGCSGSWTVQAAAYVTSGAIGDGMAATCDSSSSGATSITVTFGTDASTHDVVLVFLEASWSGSTKGFDTAGKTAAAGPTDTVTGPTLTLTGTKDLILTACYGTSAPLSAASPYDTAFSTVATVNGDTLNYLGYSYLADTTSGAGISCTYSAGQYVSANAVAFKGD